MAAALLQLPIELVEHILSKVESPLDLVNIGLTCKILHQLSEPFRYRSLEIVLPSDSDVYTWYPVQTFAKISEIWVKYLRRLEISHIDMHPNRNRGSNRLFMQTRVWNSEDDGRFGTPGDSLDHSRHCYIQALHRLLKRLGPNQLESFSCIGSEKNWCSIPLDFNISMLMALRNHNKSLNRLEITLDDTFARCCENKFCSGDPEFCRPISETFCQRVYFPHLRYLKCYAQDSQRMIHSVLSMLHGCQDTLEELEYGNYINYENAYNSADYTSEHRAAYNSWQGCRKCKPFAKLREPVHLEKLRVLKLIKNEGNSQLDLFFNDKILSKAKLKGFFCFDDEFSINIWGNEALNLTKPLLDLLKADTVQTYQFRNFLNQIDGLEYLHFLNKYLDVGLHQWQTGLSRHSSSLKELHIVLAHDSTSRQQVEEIAKYCENLEKITVQMLDGIPTCIFSSDMFPKLRYFHDYNYVSECFREQTIAETFPRMIEAINWYARSGELSDTLRIIGMGVRTAPGGDIREPLVPDGYRDYKIRQMVRGYAFTLKSKEKGIAFGSKETEPLLREISPAEYDEELLDLGGHVEMDLA